MSKTRACLLGPWLALGACDGTLSVDDHPGDVPKDDATDAGPLPDTDLPAAHTDVDDTDVDDTDVPTDTDVPSDTDTDLPVGRDTDVPTDPDPPLDTDDRHHLRLSLTADDAYRMWVDGNEAHAPGQVRFMTVDDLTLPIEAGPHVLAVEAWDLGSVVSGFLARVAVDGRQIAVSGDGLWRATDVAPPSGWTSVAFDDSAWSAPHVCDGSASGAWTRGWPDIEAVLRTGAWWQWPGACRGLGHAWFRLEFEVIDADTGVEDTLPPLDTDVVDTDPRLDTDTDTGCPDSAG